MVTSLFTFGRTLSAERMYEDPSKSSNDALVGVIMGSQSDWLTVKPCCDLLEQLSIPFEYGVVSAHRTPGRMNYYAQTAKKRGLRVLIACAGGSAHLPGMTASETRLPVLGFGPTSKTFGPMDVLGSSVRMPKGVPLAFMGLDEAGAVNAALEAVRILALSDEYIDERLTAFNKDQTEIVPFAAHD